MIISRIIKVIKIILITCGVIFLLMLALSFTSYPYWIRYWLGTSKSEFKFKPDCVIMLGAGNMPSEATMIRLYYTAYVAKSDSLKIIIAQPKDGNNLKLMKEFLINYGIDSLKIFFEPSGKNTRQQVLKIAQKFPETIKSKNVIITSPEHMRRSILVFKKAGYVNIGGISTFETNISINLSYKTKKIGGKKYIPDIGNSISLRYDIWNYIIYEIKSMREFIALAYYKLQGWI